MALFSGRASMLEVQNGALVKTARERAQRIDSLTRELQQAGREGALKAEVLKAEAGQLKAEVGRLKAEVEQLKAEVEQLKAERESYHKQVLVLKHDNHVLTDAATKYSL